MIENLFDSIKIEPSPPNSRFDKEGSNTTKNYSNSLQRQFRK